MLPWRKEAVRKSSHPVLSLLKDDGRVLFQGPLSGYPLPESVILACSEEFFNDPAPCEIHRRAVQLRLYAEMQELLPANQTLSMDDVHPRISLYCQDTHAAFIRLDT